MFPSKPSRYWGTPMAMESPYFATNIPLDPKSQIWVFPKIGLPQKWLVYKSIETYDQWMMTGAIPYFRTPSYSSSAGCICFSSYLRGVSTGNLTVSPERPRYSVRWPVSEGSWWEDSRSGDQFLSPFEGWLMKPINNTRSILGRAFNPLDFWYQFQTSLEFFFAGYLDRPCIDELP